jgi:hypothetical protein
VEVAKERSPRAIPFFCPEQLAIQRIRDLPGSTARRERVSRPIQHRPMLQDEVLPRASVPISACTRQRKVVEVKGGEIPLHLAGVTRRLSKCARNAGLERRRKPRG